MGTVFENALVYKPLSYIRRKKNRKKKIHAATLISELTVLFLIHFKACGCSDAGSKGEKCDGQQGECACHDNFTGVKCNSCAERFYSNEPSNIKECLGMFVITLF